LGCAGETKEVLPLEERVRPEDEEGRRDPGKQYMADIAFLRDALAFADPCHISNQLHTAVNVIQAAHLFSEQPASYDTYGLFGTVAQGLCR
jgi:hypothetical protein